MLVLTCHLAHLLVSLPVCLTVHSEYVLWQNSWLDLDANWGGEWWQPRNGCIRWVNIP